MSTVSKEFWDDWRWGHAHHTELLKEHRDEWVAIFHKEVVASGINLAQVEKKAKEKTGTEQLPVLFIDCGEHLYGQG